MRRCLRDPGAELKYCLGDTCRRSRQLKACQRQRCMHQLAMKMYQFRMKNAPVGDENVPDNEDKPNSSKQKYITIKQQVIKCLRIIREMYSVVFSLLRFVTRLQQIPGYPLDFSAVFGYLKIILVFKEKTCKPLDKTLLELKNPVIVNKVFRGE